MAFHDDDPGLQIRVRQALQDVGNPISYGALARKLQLVGPGTIARITAALEATMQDDATAGRPFIAAMCESKLAGGMPALGFFQKAAALGRYSGPAEGAEADKFVQQHRTLLGRK